MAATAARWFGGLWRAAGSSRASGLLGGLAAPGPMMTSPPCRAAPQLLQLQPARGMANHRHKKIVKMAKGYRGRTNCFRIAVQRVEKALQYAYRDRKVKKREFRSLWIQRISAAVQQYGMNYSRFVPGLRRANITMDRKVLADLAVTEPYSFKAVVETVRSASR